MPHLFIDLREFDVRKKEFMEIFNSIIVTHSKSLTIN